MPTLRHRRFGIKFKIIRQTKLYCWRAREVLPLRLHVEMRHIGPTGISNLTDNRGKPDALPGGYRNRAGQQMRQQDMERADRRNLTAGTARRRKKGKVAESCSAHSRATPTFLPDGASTIDHLQKSQECCPNARMVFVHLFRAPP